MNPAPPLPSVRSLLSSLTHSLDTFRALSGEAPLHMLVVFLHIAQRKGTGAAELCRLTGLSSASISRNVQSLGYGKDDAAGLGLVMKSIDPRNTRAHVIKLTPKGVALARELVGRENPSKPGSNATPAMHAEQQQSAQHLHWENWID